MTQDFATKYTGMAFVLATLFKVQFEGVTITGRTPKISEPHSPSSEGGELVLQRISLEHEGWPVIIIGSANCATNAVELRSWSYLEQAHRKRYPNKRFPLVKTDYADFFVQLADFFRDRDMEVTILNAEPEKRARAKAAAKARPRPPSGLSSRPRPIRDGWPS